MQLIRLTDNILVAAHLHAFILFIHHLRFYRGKIIGAHTIASLHCTWGRARSLLFSLPAAIDMDRRLPQIASIASLFPIHFNLRGALRKDPPLRMLRSASHVTGIVRSFLAGCSRKALAMWVYAETRTFNDFSLLSMPSPCSLHRLRL